MGTAGTRQCRTTAETNVLSKQYQNSWVKRQTRLLNSPADYLRPGTYIGVMEETPFLEPGLENARTRDMVNIVYGIMAEDQSNPVERGGHAD